MKNIKSLYQSARRYKRLLIVSGERKGPIISELIEAIWLYRHEDGSEKLRAWLDDLCKRARAKLHDERRAA